MLGSAIANANLTKPLWNKIPVMDRTVAIGKYCTNHIIRVLFIIVLWILNKKQLKFGLQSCAIGYGLSFNKGNVSWVACKEYKK